MEAFRITALGERN